MTTEHIQTLHPDPDKQGVRIEKAKYDVIRKTILSVLKQNGGMTFTELAAWVEDELRGKFDGSVRWYLMTVMLDLEARGEIRHVLNTNPQLILLGEIT